MSMSTPAPAPAHKPGHRVLDLSPFELGKEIEGTPKEIAGAEAAYGCVEWFHYLDPAATPGTPATAPRQGCARRR